MSIIKININSDLIEPIAEQVKKNIYPAAYASTNCILEIYDYQRQVPVSIQLDIGRTLREQEQNFKEFAKIILYKKLGYFTQEIDSIQQTAYVIKFINQREFKYINKWIDYGKKYDNERLEQKNTWEDYSFPSSKDFKKLFNRTKQVKSMCFLKEFKHDIQAGQKTSTIRYHPLPKHKTGDVVGMYTDLGQFIGMAEILQANTLWIHQDQDVIYTLEEKEGRRRKLTEQEYSILAEMEGFGHPSYIFSTLKDIYGEKPFNYTQYTFKMIEQ